MNKYLLTLSACFFASSAFVAHASFSFSDMNKIMAQAQTDYKDGTDTVTLGKDLMNKNSKKKTGKNAS
jgi:hypothetical protein